MQPPAVENPLGWHAETTLNDALAETIEWYRQNTLTHPAANPFPGRRAGRIGAVGSFTDCYNILITHSNAEDVCMAAPRSPIDSPAMPAHRPSTN